ncbi:MAG: tetratricopeptide repeat protein [Firmicutes bacterium]|nr:tetratricopeptide repeat protein [Bacillota bacterium]
MTCPSCNNNYDYGNICPHCMADANLYRGVARISDALYNSGLAKIKNADLSGAVAVLSKSVSVNKNNTNARNLLGLVQYHIGHVGEALKNWVISCGLQRENNEAENYINKIQNNARALENLNDAIRIYNLSIEDVRQNSTDMAVIKLRRAIDINPKFLDALNLLALCYIMQKERTKALAVIERILAIDVFNEKATRYYNDLNPTQTVNKSKPKKAAIKEEPVTPYKQVTLHERHNVNFHIEGILCLIIGAALAVAVMVVFVNPALTNPPAIAQVEEFNPQLLITEETHSQLMQEKEQEISALLEEQAELQAAADYWEDRHFNLERTLQVLNAWELFRDGYLEEAANAILAINPEGLTQEAQNWINEIRATAFPQLAQDAFNQGFSDYFASNWETALVSFERAYEFAQYMEDNFLLGDVLYYLGWTFSRIDNNAQSIHYFERLLSEFPDHRYTLEAQNRLNVVREMEE